jgi:hypothetical protein
MTRRLLVLANENVSSDTLCESIGRDAGADTDVLAIAPALNTRLAYWAGDDRRAKRSRCSTLTAS